MSRARSEGTVTTADAVASLLRSAVLSGKLPPGTHLRETELASRHGVARHTVRAAIASLVGAGLVVHEANRGAFVRIPDARSGEDLFRFRRVLETGALRLAISTGSSFAQAAGALSRMRLLSPSTPWDVVTVAHAEIHRGIVEAADSARLTAAYGLLLAELQLFLTTVRPSYTLASLIRSHDHLLDEISSGDSTRAAEALERDLADGQAALREALR